MVPRRRVRKGRGPLGPAHRAHLFNDLRFWKIRASDGRVVQLPQPGKAARGAFVRWCAEQGVERSSIGASRNGTVESSRSDAETLTFVRG